MDTYRFDDSDFRHHRYRSSEYVNDLDPFGPVANPYDALVDNFSFQRNHRFYASVPRNYDRRKQESRREVYLGRAADGEVKGYPGDDVQDNPSMYQNSRNLISESYRDSKQNNSNVNYVVYQEYQGENYRKEKAPGPGAQNVVVNLDNTGNSVSSVLGNARFVDRGGTEENQVSGGCCLSGLCPSNPARISSAYPQMDETGVCRPSVLLFLLVLLIVVFICISAVLLYLNYAVFKPRPQIIED